MTEDSGSWSSRALKVIVSLTGGNTGAGMGSTTVGMEGTGGAGDTWITKGTGSPFLFCSIHAHQTSEFQLEECHLQPNQMNFQNTDYRRELCCSSWLCLFDVTCNVLAILTAINMSRVDSRDFSQALMLATSKNSVICITLKSKTPGLKSCRWKKLQYELWPFLFLYHRMLSIFRTGKFNFYRCGKGFSSGRSCGCRWLWWLLLLLLWLLLLLLLL